MTPVILKTMVLRHNYELDTLFKQFSFMCVAQCYTDKQMSIILVIALRTELFGIRRFGLKPIIK